jgi:hypothetical protein
MELTLQDTISGKKKLIGLYLPIQIAVYVPSTKNANEPISQEELQDRVNEVRKYLAEMFGGFSSESLTGGYVSTFKELIKEDIVRVVAYATKEDFAKNKRKLITQISIWAKEWSQEAIGVEFENDLYYINQAESFKNGGKIESKNEFLLGYNFKDYQDMIDTLKKSKKEKYDISDYIDEPKDFYNFIKKTIDKSEDIIDEYKYSREGLVVNVKLYNFDYDVDKAIKIVKEKYNLNDEQVERLEENFDDSEIENIIQRVIEFSRDDAEETLRDFIDLEICKDEIFFTGRGGGYLIFQETDYFENVVESLDEILYENFDNSGNFESDNYSTFESFIQREGSEIQKDISFIYYSEFAFAVFESYVKKIIKDLQDIQETLIDDVEQYANQYILEEQEEEQEENYRDGGNVGIYNIKNILAKTNFSENLKEILAKDFTDSGYENVESLFADTPEKLPLKQKIWATSKNIQQKVNGFSSGKNTYLQANKIAEIMYSVVSSPKIDVVSDDTISGIHPLGYVIKNILEDLQGFKDYNEIVELAKTNEIGFKEKMSAYVRVKVTSYDFEEEHINYITDRILEEIKKENEKSESQLIEDEPSAINILTKEEIKESPKTDAPKKPIDENEIRRKKSSIFTLLNIYAKSKNDKEREKLWGKIKELKNSLKEMESGNQFEGGGSTQQLTKPNIIKKLNALHKLKDTNESINKKYNNYNTALRVKTGNTYENILNGKTEDRNEYTLAKKYGVSVDVIKKQLQKGIEVEREHIDNPLVRKEIALDHIEEMVDYYDRLEKMEKQAKTKHTIRLPKSINKSQVKSLGNYLINKSLSVNDFDISEYGSVVIYKDLNDKTIKEISIYIKNNF